MPGAFYNGAVVTRTPILVPAMLWWEKTFFSQSRYEYDFETNGCSVSYPTACGGSLNHSNTISSQDGSKSETHSKIALDEGLPGRKTYQTPSDPVLIRKTSVCSFKNDAVARSKVIFDGFRTKSLEIQIVVQNFSAYPFKWLKKKIP